MKSWLHTILTHSIAWHAHCIGVGSVGMVLKRVRNGDSEKEFWAIPFTVAAPIFGFMLTALIASISFNIGAVHERRAIISEITTGYRAADNSIHQDMVTIQAAHEIRLSDLEKGHAANTARLDALTSRVDNIDREINPPLRGAGVAPAHTDYSKPTHIQ